jgi:hypothetical protein
MMSAVDAAYLVIIFCKGAMFCLFLFYGALCFLLSYDFNS